MEPDTCDFDTEASGHKSALQYIYIEVSKISILQPDH